MIFLKFIPGVLISANDSITVYGFNTMRYSTDSFVALPYQSLGTQHMAVSIWNGFPVGFGLVATADNTIITYSVPTNISSRRMIHHGDKPCYTEGDSYMIKTLQQYEVLQVQGSCDITGLQVTTNQPVAFFSGSQATILLGQSSDNLVEQLPSLDKWGRHFITPLLPNNAENIVKITGKHVYTY